MSNNIERQEDNGEHDPKLLFLIIDKETALFRPLSQKLEAAGHCVEQTSSGKEALSLLEARPYSGIVVDVDMDDMDGAEFILQARQIQPELLIIVLTSHPTLRSAVAAIKASAADYLLKPADVTTIINAIFAAIEKKINQRNQLWQMVQNVLHSGNELQSIQGSSSNTITKLRNHVQIVPPLRLERMRRLVTFTDKPEILVKLSKGETAILSSLMTYPDQPVSQQQMAFDAWNYSLEDEEAQRLIRPIIFRLRQKLEVAPKTPRLILTVPRQGYVFVSSPLPPLNTLGEDSF